MIDKSLLDKAAWRLRNAREVVVFTGAGASAESGIPTFRDDDGFWREFPPSQFASWRGLLQTGLSQPERLAEFALAVIGPIASAAPNAGHRAMATMEQFVGVTVVTQNIDGLHQDAGTTLVREIHGSLLEIVTGQRRFLRLLSRRDLQGVVEGLERSRRGWFPLTRTLFAVRPLFGAGLHGLHHPNLIMFGDAMAEPAWTLARQDCQGCDVMIQVGCSQSVLPAALLPSEAQAHGAFLITIDPHAGHGDVCLRGTAGSMLPALIAKAFGETGP